MNLIFNFKKNAEELLRGRGFLNRKNGAVLEQVGYLYWLNKWGKTKYEMFCSYVSKITQDNCQIEAWEAIDMFERIFQQMQQRLNSNNSCFEQGQKIVIYQEEIDIINNLTCSLWIKQFLFLQLGVYKFFGNEWGVWSKHIRSFCLNSVECKTTEKEPVIYKVNDKARLFSIQLKNPKSGNPFSVFKLNYVVSSGSPILLLNDPREIIDSFHMLTSLSTCNKCQKEFTPSAKGKTQMCADCYKAWRNSNERNTTKKNPQ